MRRNNAIAVLAAAFGLSVAASAQNSPGQLDLTPYNIAVRAGVALPFDTGLSNYGNPLMDLGVEYTLPHSLLEFGQTYVSLDYFANNLSFADGVLPICLNQRFLIRRIPGSARRTYGFIGIGGADIAIGKANFVPAARAGVGADLGDAIFFEIAGTVSDIGQTARADAVTFSLGYRF
jgi:hypothetical protein